MICGSCGRANDGDVLFCAACGAPLVSRPGGAETRKVVTVVFTDIAGSTALGERLDPESLLRHAAGDSTVSTSSSTASTAFVS